MKHATILLLLIFFSANIMALNVEQIFKDKRNTNDITTIDLKTEYQNVSATWVFNTSNPTTPSEFYANVYGQPLVLGSNMYAQMNSSHLVNLDMTHGTANEYIYVGNINDSTATFRTIPYDPNNNCIVTPSSSGGFGCKHINWPHTEQYVVEGDASCDNTYHPESTILFSKYDATESFMWIKYSCKGIAGTHLIVIDTSNVSNSKRSSPIDSVSSTNSPSHSMAIGDYYVGVMKSSSNDAILIDFYAKQDGSSSCTWEPPGGDDSNRICDSMVYSTITDHFYAPCNLNTTHIRVHMLNGTCQNSTVSTVSGQLYGSGTEWYGGTGAVLDDNIYIFSTSTDIHRININDNSIITNPNGTGKMCTGSNNYVYTIDNSSIRMFDKDNVANVSHYDISDLGEGYTQPANWWVWSCLILNNDAYVTQQSRQIAKLDFTEYSFIGQNCTDDEDCDEGLTCQNGVCLPGNCSIGNCGVEKFCNQLTGHCEDNDITLQLTPTNTSINLNWSEFDDTSIWNSYSAYYQIWGRDRQSEEWARIYSGISSTRINDTSSQITGGKTFYYQIFVSTGGGLRIGASAKENITYGGCQNHDACYDATSGDEYCKNYELGTYTYCEESEIEMGVLSQSATTAYLRADCISGQYDTEEIKVYYRKSTDTDYSLWFPFVECASAHNAISPTRPFNMDPDTTYYLYTTMTNADGDVVQSNRLTLTSRNVSCSWNYIDGLAGDCAAGKMCSYIESCPAPDSTIHTATCENANLTITKTYNQDGGNITLNWSTSAVSGVTYYIYREIDGYGVFSSYPDCGASYQDPQVIDCDNCGSYYYEDTDLLNGTDMCYRVVGLKSNVNGEYVYHASEEVCETITGAIDICDNDAADTEKGEWNVDCGPVCAADPWCTTYYCSNGVQDNPPQFSTGTTYYNHTEDGVDCGGSCPVKCNASDYVSNQEYDSETEIGIDCGPGTGQDCPIIELVRPQTDESLSFGASVPFVADITYQNYPYPLLLKYRWTCPVQMPWNESVHLSDVNNITRYAVNFSKVPAMPSGYSSMTCYVDAELYAYDNATKSFQPVVQDSSVRDDYRKSVQFFIGIVEQIRTNITILNQHDFDEVQPYEELFLYWDYTTNTGAEIPGDYCEISNDNSGVQIWAYDETTNQYSWETYDYLEREYESVYGRQIYKSRLKFPTRSNLSLLYIDCGNDNEDIYPIASHQFTYNLISLNTTTVETIQILTGTKKPMTNATFTVSIICENPWDDTCVLVDGENNRYLENATCEIDGEIEGVMNQSTDVYGKPIYTYNYRVPSPGDDTVVQYFFRCYKASYATDRTSTYTFRIGYPQEENGTCITDEDCNDTHVCCSAYSPLQCKEPSDCVCFGMDNYCGDSGRAYCHPSTGVCVLFGNCTRDDDCGNMQYCDSAIKRCIDKKPEGSSCDDDDECITGDCISGKCAKVDCITDADCKARDPPLDVCVNGKCEYSIEEITIEALNGQTPCAGEIEGCYDYSGYWQLSNSKNEYRVTTSTETICSYNVDGNRWKPFGPQELGTVHLGTVDLSDYLINNTRTTEGFFRLNMLCQNRLGNPKEKSVIIAGVLQETNGTVRYCFVDRDYCTALGCAADDDFVIHSNIREIRYYYKAHEYEGWQLDSDGWNDTHCVNSSESEIKFKIVDKYGFTEENNGRFSIGSLFDMGAVYIGFGATILIMFFIFFIAPFLYLGYRLTRRGE